MSYLYIKIPIILETSNVITSKLAVTSLLHRFKEVLNKYTDDVKLSGKCPLPR